jgi:hypothetical protein
MILIISIQNDRQNMQTKKGDDRHGPKLCTSNTLMLPPSALSAEIVAATDPSAEAASAAIGVRWARYCLTNLFSPHTTCQRAERNNDDDDGV